MVPESSRCKSPSVNIEEVLEILAGPFGKYVFEILIHSYE